MSHPTLPYLTCLKSSFSSLSAPLTGDPAYAMPLKVTTRLIDYMIVQRSTGRQLKTDCYVELLKILPAIEQAVGAVVELKDLCTAADPDVFDRFLALTAEVQQKLFALGDSQAMRLCKAIVRIEADYSRKLEAAVIAQGAVVAESKSATAVRNVRDYSEEALAAFIRSVFPNETDLGIAKSGYISGGFSKFTMGITLSRAKALPENIILRGDADATFGGASVVDEYRLIKVLYENGVAVPKPLALEETGKVFGSRFLLVEKNPGIIIGHMFNLPTTQNEAVSKDIAAQLAAIHRVPVAALDNLRDADIRSSEKALAWIDEGFNAWKPLSMPSPVFEAAFEWLRRNAALNDKAPRTLVHGDFGLNNLLIENNKVSTILDWEFAHIGNPAYDLGYFYFMAKSIGSWETFLEAYGKAGMPVPDQDQLDYHILLAATRLGVMVCQTAAVFTSGAEPGIAGASVVSGNYYEETIKRISGALERVL
jgi:aminoglycoside phosphotransferase (APT) family kinase protein